MQHLIKCLCAAVAVVTCGAVASAQGDVPIRFIEMTAKAGILDAINGMMGHGGAWGDYDGDGYIDLFVGGFCDRPNAEYAPAPGPVASKLFRNRGDGTFELIANTPVSFFGRTSGAVFADLDNNGTLELYVANNTKGATKRTDEPQRSAQLRNVNLFRNDGGTFVDITDACGACPTSTQTARNIGVFDYDGDGLLDLLVIGDKFTRTPRCALYRNLGNLKFEDVTERVGLPVDLFGLGIAVADLNNDGKPDFFVPHSNRLFLSSAGKYREAVELRETFAWKPLDGEDWPCGAAFGDLNNDGRLDLVLSIHHVKARNRVYINDGVVDGVPRFRDVTEQVGLGDTVPARCPHVEIQDFDNDGRPDIYVSAAWRDGDGNVTPLIYHHDGVVDGLPRFSPPRAIGGPMVYYPAGPSGDYDNDGRVDLFLINWFTGDHGHLLHNESAKRRWLNVRVEGGSFNRMGIGSKVSLYRAGSLGDDKALVGYQEIQIGFGYASGQPAIAHFGLGDAAKVDVRIVLPNGQTVTHPGVNADQTLVISEDR